MIAALKPLDALRSRTLKLALGVPLARRLFRSREERLMVGFLASTFVMLPVAVQFPWFLLTAGPLVFGLAHLGATLRYAGRSAGADKRKPVALVLAVALAMVALARLYVPVTTNFIELAGCCLVLAALLGVKILGTGQTLFAFAMLTPVFLSSLHAPAATMDTLIIGHNFVGFFFWCREARRTGELEAPLFCLAVFTLIHIALFMLPGQNWEVAYAYGQAMHYFVWLRAIPEQHLASTAPVSFRRSFKFLREDFGAKGTIFVVATVLVLSTIWLLVSWEEARRLYFAVAAFHGYAELTMLAVALATIQRKAGQTKSCRAIS